jgi:membrane protease YdiL (CAAX protease family)
VLYVRTDVARSAAGDPRRPTPRPQLHAPADLAAEGGTVTVTPQTEVSLREEGPFAPLGTAIVENGALRDVLARALPIPSLSGHARVRLGVLAAAAVPMLMLLELDRELLGDASTPARAGPGRVIIDAILVLAVVVELTRRTPRVPGVAAVALFAIALRWGLVAARICGTGTRGAHPLVYLAAGISAAAAIVVLVYIPSRARVALELLGKLGITRSAFFRATSPEEPPAALVAASVACAAGLPAALHVTRLAGAGLVTQATVFIGFALGGPILARRLTAHPIFWTGRALASPRVLLLGIFSGLALTAAAVTAGRLFFDGGAELARCFARLDHEARSAQAAESAELARAVLNVRGSTLLVVLTTAVFPFAEERIFRGLLQDVLVRKYGTAYGLFAASLAFGVAHLGIYQVALYQTVLLGIGFGVAYLEGGFYAALFVHAAWNLLQLM